MTHQSIEPGDTVVYVADTVLGRAEKHSSVISVRGDTIDLGLNGRIDRSQVREVHKGGMETVFGDLEFI